MHDLRYETIDIATSLNCTLLSNSRPVLGCWSTFSAMQISAASKSSTWCLLELRLVLIYTKQIASGVKITTYCSILKLMMLSYHTHPGAHSRVKICWTPWHCWNFDIHPSIFDYLVCRNRSFLIRPFQNLFAPHPFECFSLNLANDLLTHWVFALATIFLQGFAPHLLSFLASGFFALLSRHPL